MTNQKRKEKKEQKDKTKRKKEKKEEAAATQEKEEAATVVNNRFWKIHLSSGWVWEKQKKQREEKRDLGWFRRERER